MDQQMQPNREANRWTPPRRIAPGALPELVARSLAMRRVAEQLQQVGPRIRLALIEGEAGTGKHLLARHIQSRQAIPGVLIAEEATTLFCIDTSAQSELRPEPLRAAVRRAWSSSIPNIAASIRVLPKARTNISRRSTRAPRA